jgi:hypothetical protein
MSIISTGVLWVVRFSLYGMSVKPCVVLSVGGRSLVIGGAGFGSVWVPTCASISSRGTKIPHATHISLSGRNKLSEA